MPPKSPCKPQTKKLPKYKQLSRKTSRETLPRYRYQVNPKGLQHPCNVVGEDANGATTCYSPTAHSFKRRTCNLLVDPNNPLHDFAPGLYLVGGPRFRDETLVCTAYDIIMQDEEVVDTRLQMPTQRVAVLGPYIHPVTNKLVVKCILVAALHGATTINDLGMAFATPDMSEKGVMVPDVDMIVEFIDDLNKENMDKAFCTQLIDLTMQLFRKQAPLETLEDECEEHPEFQKQTRKICKSFYEMALYFRRYAGPGRPIPTDLLPPVGDATNPISSTLVNKKVSASSSGVRVAATGSGDSDFVMQPEGTLTNMSQAHAEAIYKLYNSLPVRHQRCLTDAFKLGTPFRIINGNGRFWLNSVDPNVDGNPVSINLFDMCFGSTQPTSKFYAVSSVHGTRTYCVQIAAIQIIRTIQTVLLYVYNTKPTWALADGEFDNVHT